MSHALCVPIMRGNPKRFKAPVDSRVKASPTRWRGAGSERKAGTAVPLTSRGGRWCGGRELEPPIYLIRLF